MRRLQDVLQNKTWQNKKQEGVLVYAIGNEPFWNAAVSDQDSISFQISDWPAPLKMKISSSDQNKDSTVYFAQNDSTTIRVTVLPYFCSDGMSDMIYKNKVVLHYNKKLFTGCGMTY